MKKFVVITTINPPSDAIKQFLKFTDWNIIVVGDKKTPLTWKLKNVTFLSAPDQRKMSFKISKKIPWNSYARKNIGYLYALKNGAEVVAESDDDNFPLANWGKLPQLDDQWLVKGFGFVNVFNFFTNKDIWPRGLPLNEINNKSSFELVENKKEVGVWQSLVNKDTDVDAIYRLTNNKMVNFSKTVKQFKKKIHVSNYKYSSRIFDKFTPRKSVVLDKGVSCPFNSQNTFFLKKTFPLMYLPSTVTMRATDIFRGLIAQPILWSNNLRLGFTGPTAYQERNIHNYMDDFKEEIPVYIYSNRIIDLLKNLTKSRGLEQNLLSSYKILVKNKIILKTELAILDSWLEDVSRI